MKSKGPEVAWQPTSVVAWNNQMWWVILTHAHLTDTEEPRNNRPSNGDVKSGACHTRAKDLGINSLKLAWNTPIHNHDDDDDDDDDVDDDDDDNGNGNEDQEEQSMIMPGSSILQMRSQKNYNLDQIWPKAQEQEFNALDAYEQNTWSVIRLGDGELPWWQ